MKKIPWFEFSDIDYPFVWGVVDEGWLKEADLADEYIDEFATPEVMRYAHDYGDKDNNMIMGSMGWEPLGIKEDGTSVRNPVGPLSWLREYCRLLGFQTEDNRYICRVHGTKNVVRDDGLRYCKTCGIPGVVVSVIND